MAAFYASAADLDARFGAAEIDRLSDRSESGAPTRDAGRVETALKDADAEIDSILGPRAARPEGAPVPAILIAYACDIARWRLYDLRGAAVSSAEGVAEPLRRHQLAIRALEEIRDGKRSLGDEAPGDGTQPPAADLPSWSAPKRLFSDDALRGF